MHIATQETSKQSKHLQGLSVPPVSLSVTFLDQPGEPLSMDKNLNVKLKNVMKYFHQEMNSITTFYTFMDILSVNIARKSIQESKN